MKKTRQVYRPISYSQLRLWMQCEYAGYLRYVENHWDAKADDFFLFGTEIHKAYQDMMNGREPEVSPILDEEQVKVALANFEKIRLLAAEYNDISTEKRLFTDEDLLLIDRKNKAFFSATADLILEKEDEVFIVDYKTSFQVENETPMQLYLYGLVLHRNNYGKDIRVANFYTQMGYFKEYEFNPEKAEKFWNRAKKLIADIEERLKMGAKAEDFKKHGGSHCQYCPFAIRLCDASETKTMINGDEDAEEIANQILILEGLLKAKKEALKKYCQATGKPVIVNGEKFGFYPSESVKYPARILVAEAKELGIDLYKEKAVNIDGRKIKSILKKNPELQKIAEEIAVKSIRNTFTHKKYKEAGEGKAEDSKKLKEVAS